MLGGWQSSSTSNSTFPGLGFESRSRQFFVLWLQRQLISINQSIKLLKKYSPLIGRCRKLGKGKKAKKLPWLGFEPQTWKRGIWNGPVTGTAQIAYKARDAEWAMGNQRGFPCSTFPGLGFDPRSKQFFCDVTPMTTRINQSIDKVVPKIFSIDWLLQKVRKKRKNCHDWDSNPRPGNVEFEVECNWLIIILVIQYWFSM